MYSLTLKNSFNKHNDGNVLPKKLKALLFSIVRNNRIIVVLVNMTRTQELQMEKKPLMDHDHLETAMLMCHKSYMCPE